MNAVYLTRVDPAQNMARFYVMSIQPNLFEEWSVVREWGRIGRGGQVKVTNFVSAEDAARILLSTAASKIRRGYIAAVTRPTVTEPSETR
jgi:predicted DNA-binding WGR domain protein